MSTQRSLVIIKPDAEERSLTAEIRQSFEKNGLIPENGWRYTMFDNDFVEQFYKHHKRKKFFKQELQPYMTRNRVCYAVFTGHNINNRVKNLVGCETDPTLNNEKTLRRIYGKSKEENTIHRSDSPESAENEIKLLRKYLGIT